MLIILTQINNVFNPIYLLNPIDDKTVLDFLVKYKSPVETIYPILT